MKKYIITGLLIWIPLVITLWVLRLIVDTLDKVLLLLPPEFLTENWLGVHVPGMGVVMTLVIVLLTGLFATNLLGAMLWVVAFPHGSLPARLGMFLFGIMTTIYFLMRVAFHLRRARPTMSWNPIA